MELCGLPIDIFLLLLDVLPLNDVYSLKQVNSVVLEKVSTAQKQTTYLEDTFWGVSVKNINLIGRDYSIKYEPILFGLMTVKIFIKFFKYFKPKVFTIDCHTSTLNLTKYLLKNNLKMDIVICVNQKNLMTVNKSKVLIDAENLTIHSEDKITIEISMQLLKLKQQTVKNLIIHGEVNDMDFVFSMLPKNLEALEIYAKIGVHNTRSLPLFFELELNNLVLNKCFEVCSHPECINYNSITSQIKKCQKFPKRIAMSPFPLDAIKWCHENGVTKVDFENSVFFDFELENVMNFSTAI